MSAPNLHLSLCMTSTATRCCRLLVALALCMLVTACQRVDGPGVPAPAPQAEPVDAAVPEGMSPLASAAMPLRGYNFTDQGVVAFTVEGTYGSNVPSYGGGGSETCCVSIPFAWHAGLTVKVKWTMGWWSTPYEERKHMSIDEQLRCCARERALEKIVPVQRYEEPDVVQVFFLPNDELEVWVSRYDLGHPDHPSRREYPIQPGKTDKSKTN